MPAHVQGKHNRRQRKKLRLKEFQELGFEVTAQASRELGRAERGAFVAELIEAVESMGLLFGGGFDDRLEGFIVVQALHGSTTEEHREALRRWMEGRPELRDVVVGPLRDAWYAD